MSQRTEVSIDDIAGPVAGEGQRLVACDGRINLNQPYGREQRRGFQPPWYTVFKYRCPKCRTERRVRAGSFRGQTPVPGVGAIICGAVVAVEG